MGSLFFIGERKPKTTVTPDPVDMEKAMVAVSQRKTAHEVAAAGGIDVEKARHLIQECRKVEPLLEAAIKDGSVKTKSEANAFVDDHTEEPFPVAKFLGVIQNRLDTVAYKDLGKKDEKGEPLLEPVTTSATWPDVVAAYKDEE